MASLLNATCDVKTVTNLPPSTTRAQVFSILHDNVKMLGLNPIIKSFDRLPDSSSIAFFKHVSAEDKPPATGPEEFVPVYHVVETMGGSPEDGAQAGSWRGGWAKRFIPDTITYETSLQNTENGMISITHAPMGVNSVTRWTLMEAEEGQGLVLVKTGKVTSNRMLMTFIRTTLQESYEKLAKDFAAALEKEIEEGSEIEKVT